MRLGRPDRASFKLFEPRRRDRTDESLIPLINVVFLILIFFMIAGRMESPDPLRVNPPASSSQTGPPPPQLTLVLAADGRIAAGGEILEPHELAAWLSRELDDRRGDLQGDGTPAQPPRVTIKADMGSRADRLRQVLESLRRAGLRKITLLTTWRP